jgi:hypothetical protein
MRNRKGKQSEQRVALGTAIVWILLSVLLLSGSAALSLFYYHYIREMYAHEEKYNIVAIAQYCPQQEKLKSVYLAELLDLSIDHPTNLYRFNAKEARRTLLAHPLIREANIKKIRPGTLYIDYLLREPVAFLIDESNTAMDQEGYLFPFKPFFTPKRLPEIYVGLHTPCENSPLTGGTWGKQLQGERAALALDLLKILKEQGTAHTTHLRRIDVSQTFAPSCGQQQIVVVLEDQLEREVGGRMILCVVPQILRLGIHNYREGLSNYQTLHTHLLQRISLTVSEEDILFKLPPVLIDLRLSQLAYFIPPL